MPVQLAALAFTTLVGILAFLAVLWGVDPDTAGLSELAVFYACLFTALGGIATLGLVYFKSHRFAKEPAAFFPASLRQGLLLAVVLVSLLMLQSARTLGPLTAMPLLAAAAYIEFRAFFGGRSRKKA